MKHSAALPPRIARQLREHLTAERLDGHPVEAIAEAFAFTETGTPEQIAYALGYAVSAVQRTLGLIRKGLGDEAR